MANGNGKIKANTYDPRWFIWTIVFLVVTGISLVSYIVLSDAGTNEVPDFGKPRASTK
jgi:hypothetical protein